MAGEWIKMRTSLLTNPKVNGMARMLEGSRAVSKVLSTGFGGCMSEIVTRNVMRHVTVSSLLIVWGAANEHTRDGIFRNADLSDIDDMVGIPGFGEAMESVGWANYDRDKNAVTLPNFSEYNTSGASRSSSAKTAAERQREYRERKKSQISNVTRDVTNDVTSNRREEKRREDSKQQASDDTCLGFDEFWKAYPRKTAKANALKAWKKIKPDDGLLQSILDAVRAQSETPAWRKENGQFVPHAATWLNGRRWEDEDGSSAAAPDRSQFAGMINA